MNFNHKYIDINYNYDSSNEFDNTHLLDFASSISIDCGFFSDTPLNIGKAITECKSKNKVLGATIHLPDSILNPLELSEQEIEYFVFYQLGAISAFASSESLNIEFVRLSDKLGQIFSENLDFALCIAKSIKKFNKWLLLYSPTCEFVDKVKELVKINVVRELHLDKNYSSEFRIDFANNDIVGVDTQISKIKELFSGVDDENKDNITKNFCIDSLHITKMTVDELQLFAAETSSLIRPRPVNFNYAATSGWVE